MRPRAGLKCTSCGRAIRPTHRFCPHCGTQSTQPQKGPALQVAPDPQVDLSENRRLVTILFADLTDSTPLGERLDPEDLRNYLTAYFATTSRHIQRFGGTIEKYIGDAVMAVFGAPVAHEDDAERAIDAALAMQEAVKLLNDGLERKHGVRTHMRIGINTGEVVAGLLAGDVQGAYTVVGDTVNTAQRFESAAPHDGILVSEPTWRLTRRAFDFEQIPPLVLKGKADPQKAYRVLGRRYSDLDSAATPLIGRTSELDKLKDQLALAAAGSGSLLHVTGEAGVGKSRLLREFRSTVSPEVLQIVARCASVEIDTPYALIARLLRALLQIAPGADEPIARANVERLLSTVDDVPDPMNVDLFLDVLGYAERSTFDPQSKQRVLLGLVRRLFDRHTETEPLLVIAEDLHWSDPVSRGLMVELSRDIPVSHCLFVSTSRPEWGPPWETDVIDLSALSEEAARELVEAAFGQPVDDSLAETILSRTSGNPFFIEEVVRGLFESESLHEKDGVLTIEGGVAPRVPATVQEVLEAHLDRLPPPAKRVLQPAAVCGRTFWERVVQHVVPDQALASNLATLERESLIIPQPGETDRTYLFRHALIQEVAYQNQLQSQRRTFHAAIGGALEILYPDRLEELIGELAFHFGRSDDNPKALYWLVRAGDRARRLFANQEAVGYYRAALDRAPGGEGMLDAGSILERIGDIQHLTGRYDDAIASFCDARDRIPAPRPVTLARLQRKVGTALRIKGNYPEASAAFDEALALVGDQSDIEAAYIRLQVGELAWRTGAYAEAQTALSRAVEIATSLDRDDVLAECFKQLGNIPLHSGDPRDAIEYFRRSQAMYERLEDMAGIAGVRMNLGVVYGRMGRWDECLAELEASLSLHQRIGDLRHTAGLHNNIGELHRERSEYPEAIAAYQRARAISDLIGDADWAAMALTGLGMARVEAGEVEQGRADLLEAEAAFSVLGRSMYLPDIHRYMASAELALGDLDSATHHAERSIEFARAANARHEEAMTQRVLGEIALAQGDVAEARRLLETSRSALAEIGEAGELARTEAVLQRLG